MDSVKYALKSYFTIHRLQILRPKGYTHTMNQFTLTAQRWFYSFMHVQLFLSLLSLPILVAWGLPFSLMTVFGNLIFTPFLTLFLLVSTGVFFSELLKIPNGWLIYALEKLCTLWMYCLDHGSTSWLYGIDRWGIILCILGAIIACVLLHHKQWGKERNSLPLFLLLLATPFAYQKVRSFFTQKGRITCIKKNALITSNNGTISVIDYGALGEKKSAGTWIQYTFLAEALKQCGSVQFDTVTCPYTNAQTLEALVTLCKHARVKKISIAHPRRQTKQYKDHYKALEETAKKEGVSLLT